MNVPFKKWQRKYAENENAFQSIWLNVLKGKNMSQNKNVEGRFITPISLTQIHIEREKNNINKKKWSQSNPIQSHLCHQIEYNLVDCIRLG